MANISPQRNTLVGLAHHCPLATIDTPRGFLVNDAKAFVLGTTTVEHEGKSYTFLVLGDSPPKQGVEAKPGTYRVVRLRSASPEEFHRWNRSGGASRQRPDEVRCLEALQHRGGNEFATIGQAECYVDIV